MTAYGSLLRRLLEFTGTKLYAAAEEVPATTLHYRLEECRPTPLADKSPEDVSEAGVIIVSVR